MEFRYAHSVNATSKGKACDDGELDEYGNCVHTVVAED